MFKILKRLKDHRFAGNSIPPVGGIDFGDLARLKPLSEDWGQKRGGPIDRYYIENFLKENNKDIKGVALEVRDDEYLKRFGADQVSRREILDIDPQNRLATIVADLAKAEHIPSHTYDCMILTQTLQLIYDLQSAVGHVYRILKPGGVVLITIPGISHFPHKTMRFWSFTENSLRRLLEEEFSKDNIHIETHGNVWVASAFLYGMGLGEIKKEVCDYRDPDYQFLITARAVK